MNEIDIFKEKAKNGYTFCFADNCPLKERCLHYLVGQQMSDSISTYSCVNPRFQDVGTANCSLFRKAEKVKYAKGMMHIFIPPAVQEEIRQYFREAGWNSDVIFDGFIEDYEW